MNFNKLSPISFFVFLNEPNIDRHGPHHSEYASITVIANQNHVKVRFNPLWVEQNLMRNLNILSYRLNLS